MSRRCGLVLVLGLVASGAAILNSAVLPDEFGAYKRVGKGAVNIADRAVWDEYGFQTAERGEYAAAGTKAVVSVWQLKDTTGAWAAAQWLQPGATHHGNYVLRIDGQVSAADLAQLKLKLPNVDRSANPSLPAFFPERGRIPDSTRYLLGPVSLAKFEPRVSPELAGFNKGAEGQLTRYRTSGREAALLLFSYPTPQIAGERFREFEKRQDLQVRRHGPMVAVVFDAEPAAAERLLDSVSYQPKVSWSERVPKYENPGDMILAICILAGALIAASVILGLFFGGLRQVLGSKFGVQAIDENFTSLHLGDRS